MGWGFGFQSQKMGEPIQVWSSASLTNALAMADGYLVPEPSPAQQRDRWVFNDRMATRLLFAPLMPPGCNSHKQLIIS